MAIPVNNVNDSASAPSSTAQTSNGSASTSQSSTTTLLKVTVIPVDDSPYAKQVQIPNLSGKPLFL
jgi:hypothetical protein